MADETTINATVDAYIASFAASDRAAYVACFADDAWIEDPVGTPRRQGRDAIGGFWDDARAMASAIELRPTGPRVVIGSEAAFVFQVRPEIGGQTFVLDVVDHLTFDDDGRIATLRAFFDPASMRPAAD